MSTNDEKTAMSVTGIVLLGAPAGEYDRRVVLLTKENGKISCFARGARRQGNSLMAAAEPFSFGRFRLMAGRSSYIMTEAEIDNYFGDLRTDMEKACYGMYFLEVAEYITRENNDEAQILALLYMSLRALEKPAIPARLVRAVYEIRTVESEGELPELSESEREKMDPAAVRALLHITQSPLEKLYTFGVNESVLLQLEETAGRVCSSFFGGHPFSSLSVLQAMR